MSKLWLAIKDWWAVFGTLASGILSAYDIAHQWLAQGYIRPDWVWPVSLLLFIFFVTVAVIKANIKTREQGKSESRQMVDIQSIGQSGGITGKIEADNMYEGGVHYHVSGFDDKKVDNEKGINVSETAVQLCRLAEEFSCRFRHIRDAGVFEDEITKDSANENIFLVRQNKAKDSISKLIEIFQSTKYYFDCRVELEQNMDKLVNLIQKYSRALELYADLRGQQVRLALPGTPLPYGNLDNFMDELFQSGATRTFDEVDKIVETITQMLLPYIRGNAYK